MDRHKIYNDTNLLPVTDRLVSLPYSYYLSYSLSKSPRTTYKKFVSDTWSRKHVIE